MKCIIIVAIFAILIPSSFCKRFTKCELARELLRLGLPKSQLPDWICLINAESSMDTSKVHTNTNNSKDYGLFQINDKFWCTNGSNGKDCSVNCQNLLNDNIADDVACAKKVYGRHGFNAWYGWKNKCQGTKPGVSECF